MIGQHMNVMRNSGKSAENAWRRTERIYTLAFLFYLLLAVTGVVLVLVSEAKGLGWGLINTSAFYYLTYCAMIVHEIGHAAMARLFGARILGLKSGCGRVSLRFRLVGSDFDLRLVPYSAHIVIKPELAAMKKLPAVLILVSGSLANILVFLVYIFLGGRFSLMELYEQLQPLPLFAAGNALLPIISFWPHRIVTSGSVIESDGLACKRLLFPDSSRGPSA